jgi:hypothetical protein
MLWAQYCGSSERERNYLSRRSETVAEDDKSSLFPLFSLAA